ncbi:MAG: DUF4493 domain-containing protein [Bacteroidales bacterium]|nr:DUF4493 domain-containing protein [Bacteroidales bacterium]
MKSTKSILRSMLPLLLAAATACNALSGGNAPGFIRIRFPEHLSLPREAATKAAPAIPDTNDFILSIVNAGGNVIFRGSYGSAPEEIAVEPGSYTVSVLSREFDGPCFEAPQYGDRQVVMVSQGQTAFVDLECSQLNCGVTVSVSEGFKDEYPGHTLFVKGLDGRLVYSYSEKRTGYFNPGNLSLILSGDDGDRTLLTRNLQPREMLSVSLNTGDKPSGSSQGGSFSIELDTCRVWMSEEYLIGAPDNGKSPSSALSVKEALSHLGSKGVWVYGYIVGGDLSSAKCSFDPPFSSRTNLAIAAKSSCRDKNSCLSVQLQKGDIRDALNLVDHEDNLGRQLYLYGDLVEAYYGIPGLQNVSGFKWK